MASDGPILAMQIPTTGYVYVLIDPRTRAKRYVGETEHEPLRRLSTHIANAYDVRNSTREYKDQRLVEWLKELLSLGLAPIVETLEEVQLSGDPKADKRLRWEREQRWKKQLRHDGCDLLNGVPGVRKGHKFEEGKGPTKLRGRKRPDLSAKLTGRRVSDEHRQSLRDSQRKRWAELKASGGESEELRQRRSESAKRMWERRRAARQSA